MKLFAALWPDDAVRRQLGADLAALARQVGGRASPCANLHLTVAFIGQVPDARVAAIAARVAACRPPPFDLLVDTIDAFVSQRVLFRGLSTVPPALLAAQRRLVDALVADDVPVDRRPFRPHVTLARGCDRARLAALVGDATAAARAAGVPVHWPAPGWVLAESRPGPRGVEYRPIPVHPAPAGTGAG